MIVRMWHGRVPTVVHYEVVGNAEEIRRSGGTTR